MANWILPGIDNQVLSNCQFVYGVPINELDIIKH